MLLPFLALLPQTVGAEKLNAPLDFAIIQGDVGALSVSANGEWIAYSAQQEEATNGLYVVKSDGSLGPVRVSPPGSPLGFFALNRLGNRLVFRGNARTLLSSDSAGILTQLNPPLVSGGEIFSVRVSPSGLHALYHADQEVDGRRDLYTVPLFGAPLPVKLGESVQFGFDFSADGTRVLWVTPQNGSRARLFAAPVNGGGVPAALSAGVPQESIVVGSSPAPATDPSGQRAVFVLDHSTQRELWSAPIDATSGAVELSGALVSGGDVETFRISPDGQRVVYRADALVNDRAELFSVPIDGSAPPVLVSGGHHKVGDFAIAPSGQEVVFEAEVRGRLFRAPISGLQAPLQLTLQGGDGSAVLGVEELTISPDGTRAVYVISPSNFFAEDLRSVPLDASSADVRLCHPLSVNEFMRRFVVRPNGDVLYLAGGYPVSNALYRTRQDGTTTPVALHPGAATGKDGTASDFVLAGDDIVFRSDIEAPQRTELFSVPSSGATPPVRRNGQLYSTRGFENVTQIGVSADGRHAAYATAGGLHRLDLATPGVATTVAVPGSSSFTGIDLTSHPTRFTYRALVSSGTQLFSAPFDGSSPPLQISSGNWAVPFGVASQVFASPWLVYGTSGYFGPEGTYLVPPDGSSAASFLAGPFVVEPQSDASGSRLLYRLQAYNPFTPQPTKVLVRDTLVGTSFEVAPVAGPLAATAAALRARFSADGTRIVFVRDQELELQFELYSVLSTPGATPVKLSGNLPAQGDVARGFELTPDATRVVFAADRDVDGALQLFVSPLDGSLAPRELSPTLAPGESVGVDAAGAPLAWITPDSSRALFVLAGSHRRLLSVPLDGSSPAVALGTPPAPGAGLPPERGAVQFARNGLTAVYRAAVQQTDRFELFAAPVAGGPGVRLAASAGAAQDVEPGFVVLRNGREVLLRGDLATDGRLELWLAPVDGTRQPRRVSALGPHDADVEPDFVLSSDEAHVYYRADAERDGEVEFFRHPLRAPAVRPR